MCFSQRFIFALMLLCSALYWCFCHVVKIYGAISLPWNGLIELSDLADLWLNMAGRGKGEKDLYLYSDWWCSLSLYKIGKRYNPQTGDIILNIFPTCSIKSFQFFLCLWWVFPFPFGLDNFLRHLCSSTAHNCMWKHLVSDWYLRGVCICFILSLQNGQLLHVETTVPTC